MQKPKDYEGPLAFAVPDGYIDVTSLEDHKRKGIPRPDHPYYRFRAKLLEVLNSKSVANAEEVADAIMNAFDF